MQLTTIFLALLAAASFTTAQIMPLPKNLTFANNPIPGASKAASNLTILGHKADLKTTTSSSSGRCGIHVIQSRCSESFDGIFLRSVDWAGTIQYEGSCAGTVCAWPLLGMGDFLVSVQQGYTTGIKFYRQGTVSADSWANTDPEPRCKLGGWSGCRRQFDCGFECGAYVGAK